MKVLLFEPYYTRIGHFKSYLDRLHTFLTQRSIQVHSIIGAHFPVNDINEYEITKVKVRGKGRFVHLLLTWPCYVTLYKKLRDSSITHIHILDYEIVLLYLFSLISGITFSSRKIFITVHSINFLINKNRLLWPYQCIARKAYKHLENIGTQFFCNGDYIYRFLNESYHIRKSQLHSIGWGLVAAKTTDIIKRKSNTILFLGVIRKDKNLEYTLSQLGKVDAEFHLTIAGYPQDYSKETIKNLITQNSLENKTSLELAYLTDERIHELLAMHEFILIPYASSNQSNSGPLMDALAYNCIPIASAYGQRKVLLETLGLPTMFRFNDRPSLKEIVTEVLKLDNNEREKLRSRIDNMKQEFDWNTIFHKYLNIYQN